MLSNIEVKELLNAVGGTLNIHQDKERYMLEIEKYENAVKKLEDSLAKIGKEMDSNISEATMDKLDEMSDKLQDKIDELQDKIDELQDKIDELDDNVDDDLIKRLSQLPGLDINEIESDSYGIDVEIPQGDKVDMETFLQFQQKYSGVSSEEREKRRVYKMQSRYNVNFCADAKIDSFCCAFGNHERPENLIDDDPNLKTKWCADKRHVVRNNIILPHWVIIDFGASRTFNQLRMVKAGGGGESKSYNMSAWNFEVSEDKENWTEFNRETHDKSDIYVKTFPEQTGRYVRLIVDAAESDPNNKHGHVRIYDLRIEMTELDDNTITFDDIIAIAPYAKRETVDKLAEKLAKIEATDFSKIKQVVKYLTTDAINNLLNNAFERNDFSAVYALAPHASKDAIEKIALALNIPAEMDTLKALAPFIGKEAIAGILIGSGQLTIENIRNLAPVLGSELIDELLQKLWDGGAHA